MDPLENTENLEQQEEEKEGLHETLMKEQREFWEQQSQAQAQAAVESAEEAEPDSTGSPVGALLGQARDMSGGITPLGALGEVVENGLNLISNDRDEEADSQRVAGKGGTERNPFDAIVSRGADLIDNTFNGDQETLEEIQERMDTNTAEKKERDANAPALQRALSEPGRAVSGSFLGAAESGLEFAELVGDTAKTFASKINLVGYDPTDDPFSDKYNWASWNLGKDDIGAQTGVGKITQGFGEFAVTFAATGGGKAATSVFTQGIKKAGMKGVTSAMAKEAVEGVAADMVMAASGEGNLTNLIKDNAPDWYPTWLTLLAVDEDDNPFEAAFKTAFEGGILGAPIGAVGAFINGVRGVNTVAKANPNAPLGELNQVAVDSANESFSSVTPTKPTKVNLRVLDEQALNQLEALQKEGIPATWDDVAQVVPQMFTPGTRVIDSPEFNPEAMRLINELDPTDPDAGISVNPFTGEVPTSGTMVAVDGATLKELDDPDAVSTFIGQYYDILTREDAFLRSWVSKETDKPIVEISRLVADGDEAIQLGKIFDQETVFRLDDFTEIPTGGLDQLKNTQGDNLKAFTTRAPQSTPVAPQRAATQLYKAEQKLSPLGGAQNMLTDNQVRRLGSDDSPRSVDILGELNDGLKIDVSELAREANMTELEVVQSAVNGLGDDFAFIPASVEKLELNAEGYLTRAGIVQSRIVMKELASRLARTTFKANDASAKGMQNMDHLSEMVTTLKAFMKAYKVSANLNSKRLAAGATELPPEFGVKGNQLPNLYPKSTDVDQAFDTSMKMLDRMEEGLRGNNPKARRQALMIGAQLELLGDQPFRLAQGISTMWEVGSKYGLKVMYNSMLSSPATHLVNLTSNALALILRPTAAFVGGDIRSRKAAIASRYALGETLSDAMFMASRKWIQSGEQVKGIDLSTGEASMAFDRLEAKVEASNDIKLQTGFVIMKMFKDMSELPGMSWPSRLLTSADEFFKVATQRMEYKRMMMEEAIDLNGNDIEGTFKYLLEKNRRLNFTTSGESLNKELNRLAKENTFQQDLEGSAAAFGRWVESYAALRIFFPFVRTGHNVAVYTASYVPFLAQATEKLNKGLDFHKLPPYEQAVIKGRQAIGTAFIASVGLMAANGMVTGNGPMEREAKKRWLETNQPRSIKLGDTWVSLDRLEPFGPILSAVADLHYAVANGDMKQDRGAWFAQYLGLAMAVNLTDRTFFQGFKDLASFISPRGSTAPANMTKTGINTLNNLFPAAGLRRTLKNMWTPYMEEYNQQWDRTLSEATFGVLGEKATKYDFITGEPIPQTGGGINALLPFKINNRKQDPVKLALMDIEYNSDAIIEELGRTGVKLTPDQISRLQYHMGKSGLRKELLGIINAPDWKKSVERYKQKLRGTYNVHKTSQGFYKEIHDKITLYADDALSQLKQDFPELDEALTDYQMNAANDRYGGLTDYYQQ